MSAAGDIASETRSHFILAADVWAFQCVPLAVLKVSNFCFSRKLCFVFFAVWKMLKEQWPPSCPISFLLFACLRFFLIQVYLTHVILNLVFFGVRIEKSLLLNCLFLRHPSHSFFFCPKLCWKVLIKSFKNEKIVVSCFLLQTKKKTRVEKEKTCFCLIKKRGLLES